MSHANSIHKMSKNKSCKMLINNTLQPNYLANINSRYSSTAAWAAATRAIGTRNGLHDT